MSHANTPRDWVLRAPQHGAVERIEAYFAGHGYDPHRHDTYAIGQTLAGVQSFRYRRSQRHRPRSNRPSGSSTTRNGRL